MEVSTKPKAKTFTIPIYFRYSNRWHLTNEEKDKQANGQEQCKTAFLEFLVAASTFHGKKWKIEVGEWKGITINGLDIHSRFNDKWISIDNGAYKKQHKLSTMLYYGAALTMENHGLKVVKIIQSVIDDNNKRKNSSNSIIKNTELGDKILQYLVSNNELVIYPTELDGKTVGYSMTADDKLINFTYKTSSAWEILIFTYEVATKSVKLKIKDQPMLTMAGNYASPELIIKKWSDMNDVLASFETTYRRLSILIPEAIEKIG